MRQVNRSGGCASNAQGLGEGCRPVRVTREPVGLWPTTMPDALRTANGTGKLSRSGQIIGSASPAVPPQAVARSLTP
jgi:hypothetical protein